MTNSKHVPKRRFKEFDSDGEWKQNQLKELAEFSKGRGYSKSELQTDGQPIILYGRLYTKYETVISTVDTFTHIKENSVLSKGGEVLVPSSGESAEDIARASVVAEEGIIIGGDLNIIKLCKKIEPIFLSLTISNGKQKEEVSKRAQGKSVVHVNNDDLKQVNVLFPSISEQIQIGKFFKTIDALISNHQHKLDKLKNLKKAYLSEMFPAEGERVPKRRFPGFEGEWEQMLLGKIGKAQSGIGFPDSEQGGKVGIPFYKVSDMNNNGNEHEMVFANNYVTLEQMSQRGWKAIHDVPAIFFAKVGAAVLLNRKRLCRVPFLMDNNTMAFSLDTSKVDTNFAKTMFETVDLTSLVQIGALPSYNTRDVESISVLVPATKEQKQIGDFFHKLDNSISLQQQKLDKLNDLKKAYLNELFV